jgi:hypothetical protein
MHRALLLLRKKQTTSNQVAQVENVKQFISQKAIPIVTFNHLVIAPAEVHKCEAKN